MSFAHYLLYLNAAYNVSVLEVKESLGLCQPQRSSVIIQ